MTNQRPIHLDVDRRKGLRIHWPGGRESFYPVEYLRRMSPSAEARELREQLARNPLTVLPDTARQAGPLEVRDAELVGGYAVRIRFSDGHDTGIYSWDYLQEIDPDQPPPPPAADGEGVEGTESERRP